MDDEREQIQEEGEQQEDFAQKALTQATVPVETGRGQVVDVQVGAPFVETVEKLAEQAHYGGYFRVFLNEVEMTENPWLDDAHTQLNPTYPKTVQQGMRISLTSYDKVGV